MCSLFHTIWVGGTCFSTGAGATTIAYCLLEFPRQWGGHTTVFMSGKQFSGWISPWRSIVSKSRCQRPTSNRISLVGHCGWYTATGSIQCGRYIWSEANLIMQLHMLIGCILVLSCGCCVFTSYSLCKPSLANQFFSKFILTFGRY